MEKAAGEFLRKIPARKLPVVPQPPQLPHHPDQDEQHRPVDGRGWEVDVHRRRPARQPVPGALHVQYIQADMIFVKKITRPQFWK